MIKPMLSLWMTKADAEGLRRGVGGTLRRLSGEARGRATELLEKDISKCCWSATSACPARRHEIDCAGQVASPSRPCAFCMTAYGSEKWRWKQ